ncbi:MAG: helix-turn-helix domain-containing protein [Lentisphaerota bacterium]
MKKASDNLERPSWMRRAAAAKHLGISGRTLSDWQNRRLIPFVKVSRKVVLFRASDLDAALGRLTTNAVG